MLRVLNYHSDYECHSMGVLTNLRTLNCKSISAISDAVPVTTSEIDEVVFVGIKLLQAFQNYLA